MSVSDDLHSSFNTEKRTETKKLPNSATDHLLVICSIKDSIGKTKYTRKITKRSMKNFTAEKWNEELLKMTGQN